MILFCSHLALSDEGIVPLTLKDWNPLARKIQASVLKRPAALLGLNTHDLHTQLEISMSEAERLVRLSERSTVLAIELERIASMGIRVLTRADTDYPNRYRKRLMESAPTILFYAGEKELLGQPGIAVVGSRNLDEIGQACADFVGNACGLSGLVLYSGGAKGVDTISMNAALSARGTAVGILANSLEKEIRSPAIRAALLRGDLCLVTPYSPSTPFSVGIAMGRNKLIYTLADHAIVVASDVEKGGTWAGATEALKNRWIPVFVLNHANMPKGNQELLQKGALPFPYPFAKGYLELKNWLDHQAVDVFVPAQPTLF